MQRLNISLGEFEINTQRGREGDPPRQRARECARRKEERRLDTPIHMQSRKVSRPESPAVMPRKQKTRRVGEKETAEKAEGGSRICMSPRCVSGGVGEKVFFGKTIVKREENRRVIFLLVIRFSFKCNVSSNGVERIQMKLESTIMLQTALYYEKCLVNKNCKSNKIRDFNSLAIAMKI